MEQTDWIHQGLDAAQARFLMVTAITHHRFNSPVWGEHEVRKLHGVLAEIDASVAHVQAPRPARWRVIWACFRRVGTRRPKRARGSRSPVPNNWLGLR